MGFLQSTHASVQSIKWRRHKCPKFVALMNNDADIIVVTALESLPFRCHEDILVMPLFELLSVARYLNLHLPAALRIDVGLRRTEIQLRHDIEAIIGYSRSAPGAMKVPFSLESVSRKFDSPKTPVSPLAMTRNRSARDISFLGRPMTVSLEEGNTSETVDSFADHRRTLNDHHPSLFFATPTASLRSAVKERLYSSVSSRRNEHPFPARTPRRLDQSTSRRSTSTHHTATFKSRSPRTPKLNLHDMDLLVSTMMSTPVSSGRTVHVAVGEFGVL